MRSQSVSRSEERFLVKTESQLLNVDWLPIFTGVLVVVTFRSSDISEREM